MHKTKTPVNHRAVASNHSNSLERSDAVIAAKLERKSKKLTGKSGASGTNQNYDWKRDHGDFSFDKLLEAKRHIQQMPVIERPLEGGSTADAGLWTWEWLGPGNIGGRIRSMVIDPTNPQHMFVGGVGGGVWRTVNAGFQWVPLNDFLPSIAISTMVMDPSNPNIIYVGTGENFSADGLVGAGIFKTIDGGNQWTRIESTRNITWINRLAIDPENGKHMLVATIWGIFFTDDGFTTWDRPLPDIDIRDVKFKPTDGKVAVAGSNDGRIFYSLDGGENWDEATWTGVPAQSGLYRNAEPDGDSENNDVIVLNSTSGFSTGDRVEIRGHETEIVTVVDVSGDTLTVSDLQFAHGAGEACESLRKGRVELAFVPSNPFNMYASMNVGGGTIWHSSFDGRIWELVSNTNDNYLGKQGDYDNTIWVAPDDENTIVVGGIDLWRSTSGGESFSRISDWREYHRGRSAHADHHYIVNHPGYDGGDNRTVYFLNDGGIQMTEDVLSVEPTRGWTNLANNLGITQFYTACASSRANMILGGTQDNSVLRHRTADGAQAWYQAFTGDGGCCVIDDRNETASTIVTETQFLNVMKSTTGGSGYYNSSGGLGDAGDKTKARFVAPIAMDPENPETLVAGSTSIWHTKNGATFWSRIRLPLTVADGTNAPKCSTLTIAPHIPDRIWAGYESGGSIDPPVRGRVSRTTTFADEWIDVDVDEFGNDLLPNRTVTDIAINPIQADEVFVTFAGYEADSVWFTPDSGRTWVQRTGTPPFDLPVITVNTITFHPGNSNWVYVGTDLGVFASEDKGRTWRMTTLYEDNEGPLNTQVVDLVWQGNYLVAATHGRGMYRMRPFDYVYSDWSNIGIQDGSFTYPFDTVGEAVSAAGHGTEMVITSGTYDEPADVLFNKRGIVRPRNGSVLIRR